MLLKNKTAVVTGCNRGIGKKILEVFSANGATVFACVRNIDEEFKSFLNELKQKFNNQIIPIQFDLNDEKKIKNEFKLISSLFNKLKLVNKKFTYLSIGMSNDYKLAINEGGNMIRVGSRIFGER